MSAKNISKLIVLAFSILILGVVFLFKSAEVGFKFWIVFGIVAILLFFINREVWKMGKKKENQ